MVRRDTHINLATELLESVISRMEVSASELSRSNVVKLRREAAAIRRLTEEVNKVIEQIYERRPE